MAGEILPLPAANNDPNSLQKQKQQPNENMIYYPPTSFKDGFVGMPNSQGVNFNLREEPNNPNCNNGGLADSAAGVNGSNTILNPAQLAHSCSHSYVSSQPTTASMEGSGQQQQLQRPQQQQQQFRRNSGEVRSRSLRRE